VTRRRVVVTGMGLTSPIGDTLDQVSSALQEQRHGIVQMPQWDAVKGLETRLAAPAGSVDLSKLPRKKTRTMGRVSLLSVYASDRAIAQAGLDEETLGSGRCGLAYGSTHGSTSELELFCRTLFGSNGLAAIGGTAYLKFMSHTCAANLALAYGIRGRVVPTVSACASGSQAIGVGYETIQAGHADVMLCGGAEELHFLHAGVFDVMYATSTRYNATPDQSPRPFDGQRDGLVIGEGAATLVLEEYERARARGATILGEVLGFGMNCDGAHVTSPSAQGMAAAMRLALGDAGIASDRVDYINAHGTATELGDIAESEATREVMGPAVPFSSTKSYTAHTLGACGALESIFCLLAMRDGFLPSNRNLSARDPRCAPLEYLLGPTREAQIDIAMNNNFAFGGINTSLLLGRVS
jgi:3-oxoacyl-[acyl-carrier-protein] synthase II